METKILQPIKTTLNIKGKIAYGDSSRSWSNIRLKKEVVDEFPALREKQASFSYQMLFYRTYDELEKVVRKMKREKLPLPLLLFLQKEPIVRHSDKL